MHLSRSRGTENILTCLSACRMDLGIAVVVAENDAKLLWRLRVTALSPRGNSGSRTLETLTGEQYLSNQTEHVWCESSRPLVRNCIECAGGLDRWRTLSRGLTFRRGCLGTPSRWTQAELLEKDEIYLPGELFLVPCKIQSFIWEISPGCR